MNKAIGQKVRLHRTIKGLTQAELAEAIDKTPSFIGHLERGTRTASFETIVLIADALELSVDYLLGRVVIPSTFFAGGTQKAINKETCQFLKDLLTLMEKHGWRQTYEE